MSINMIQDKLEIMVFYDSIIPYNMVLGQSDIMVRNLRAIFQVALNNSLRDDFPSSSKITFSLQEILRTLLTTIWVSSTLVFFLTTVP